MKLFEPLLGLVRTRKKRRMAFVVSALVSSVFGVIACATPDFERIPSSISASCEQINGRVVDPAGCESAKRRMAPPERGAFPLQYRN